MSALEAAAKVKDAIQDLKKKSVKERQLVEVLELSHTLTGAMECFFSALDTSIRDEFQDIAGFIAKARDEIGGLRPNDIQQNRIPKAGEELEAIVRDTEKATENIMTMAEDVMALDPDDANYSADVMDRMMVIIEACSFQDLTGQRVQKIVSTLAHIEERISKFAEAMGVDEAPVELSAEEQRAQDLLLNGPAINGPETAQDDIDAMFASAGDGEEDVSQDDIDALFD